MNTVTCPACHQEAPSWAITCPHCGAFLPSRTAVPSSAPPPPAPPEANLEQPAAGTGEAAPGEGDRPDLAAPPEVGVSEPETADQPEPQAEGETAQAGEEAGVMAGAPGEAPAEAESWNAPAAESETGPEAAEPAGVGVFDVPIPPEPATAPVAQPPVVADMPTALPPGPSAGPTWTPPASTEPAHVAPPVPAGRAAWPGPSQPASGQATLGAWPGPAAAPGGAVVMPAAQQSNTMATVSFYLGIISGVLALGSCIPYAGFCACILPVAGIVAAVLGFLARSDINNLGGSDQDRSHARWGIIAGLATIPILAIGVIINVAIISAMSFQGGR